MLRIRADPQLADWGTGGLVYCVRVRVQVCRCTHGTRSMQYCVVLLGERRSSIASRPSRLLRQPRWARICGLNSKEGKKAHHSWSRLSALQQPWLQDAKGERRQSSPFLIDPQSSSHVRQTQEGHW